MKTNILDFDAFPQKVSIVRPQFLAYKLKCVLRTAKTYPNFLRMDPFLRDL